MLYNADGEFKNNDEYKMFLEYVDNSTDKIEAAIVGLFMHLIKWRYQPSRQSRSWLDSIIKQYNAIQRIFNGNKISIKNISNKINLQKAYKIARKNAIKEIQDEFDINLTRVIPDEIPTMSPYIRDMEYLNWDWKFITNKDYIIDYLYTFYDPTGIYAIDLDKELRDFK